MAQQPIGLFGLKVLPGEETQLDSMEDVRITNISFGEIVNGTGRTIVRVHHRPVPAFDEDSDDEDEFDEFSEGDDEEEEDEDEEDLNEKVNGAKAAIEDLEGEDEDDDDEEEEEEEEETFILCSLYPGKQEQVTVDLHFSVDDDVRFSISGDNAVEIMGNYLSPGRFDDDPDSDELIDSEDDEEIDSDELEMLEGDSDDDEGEIDEDDIVLELDSEDEDDEDMENDRLEIVEEEVPPAKAVSKANGKKRTAEQAEVSMDEDATAPVTDAELAVIAKEMGMDISKLTKNQRKKLNKRLRADDESAAETSTASIAQEQAAVVTKEAGKPAKVAAKETVKKDGKPTSKKVTLPSGVIIEDVKVGSGPQAKAGNRLGMRYVGRLQNGKQFDANTKGKPFTFKLGKGEVIGGWDQGLRGMQVGGERRLIIPPKQAYGARGAPPDIPKNATLVFDVKLVEIK